MDVAGSAIGISIHKALASLDIQWIHNLIINMISIHKALASLDDMREAGLINYIDISIHKALASLDLMDLK